MAATPELGRQRQIKRLLQGQPGLQKKLKGSLDYRLRPCLKQQNKKHVTHSACLKQNYTLIANRGLSLGKSDLHLWHGSKETLASSLLVLILTLGSLVD